MDERAIGHAELELEGEIVMLATPSLDYQRPKRHRQDCEAADRWLDNPWVVDGVLVEVDDLDAHHGRAVAAGATASVRWRTDPGPAVHRRGSRGPPLDVPAAMSRGATS